MFLWWYIVCIVTVKLCCRSSVKYKYTFLPVSRLIHPLNYRPTNCGGLKGVYLACLCYNDEHILVLLTTFLSCYLISSLFHTRLSVLGWNSTRLTLRVKIYLNTSSYIPDLSHFVPIRANDVPNLGRLISWLIPLGWTSGILWHWWRHWCLSTVAEAHSVTALHF